MDVAETLLLAVMNPWVKLEEKGRGSRGGGEGNDEGTGDEEERGTGDEEERGAENKKRRERKGRRRGKGDRVHVMRKGGDEGRET